LRAQQRSWRDLGIFSGKPLFDEPLHVNKPNAINRERLISLIDPMLSRRWFSDGELVREFEREIARLAGAAHCVATCNGTLALQIVLRTLGLSGEAIVPSFTFVATAQALRWLNLTPVYCDVSPETHTIDPKQVESLITPRTQAIVGVHLWGQPCDIAALSEIADRHGLALVFDAAHGLGSTYRGRPIGGFGVAEVFSFHATKFVNTGEGGAITTNDERLAARLRSERRFGFDSEEGPLDAGTNGKMAEICAAVGLTYLECFDQLIAANQATHRKYQDGLAGIPGVSILALDEGDRNNHQYVVTEIDESRAGLSRDELMRVLQADNILAKRYFYPGCHRTIPGRHGEAGQLPVTEKLVGSVLVLPGGASISPDQVETVCETLRLAVENGDEIRQALGSQAACKAAQ
jgi:dTDP-4-amino-4,6-dideoxygalactose transaminase